MSGDTSDLFQEEVDARNENEQLKALVIQLKQAGQALSAELKYFVDTAIEDCAEPTAFPAAQLAIAEWREILQEAGLYCLEEVLGASEVQGGTLRLE